ncbi:hypothetical protein OROGR_013116 [Orobanche gracilis]
MSMAMVMRRGKGEAVVDTQHHHLGLSFLQQRIIDNLTIKDKAAGDIYGFPQHSNISRIINHTTSSRMSWADLPADILFIIFGFLHNVKNFNMIDLYQCLAVCRSWRFVAKQIWKNHILPTTPWLVSIIDVSMKIAFKTNLYKFHKHPPSLDINKNDASVSSTLDLLHLRTYASYDGWLLLGNFDNLPFLYNPITLFSNKRGEKGYYNDGNNFLAFCRPASSISWVILHEKSEDFIFSGGMFYTVGSGGELYVYNSEILNGNGIGQPWKEIKIAGSVFDSNLLLWSDDCCFFYLLESKHQELLMIMRPVERGDRTTSFRIFKLNRGDNKYNSRRNDYYPNYWKEINNLPEKESIILLWNEGMIISVDDHNGYKSICIYFYDEDRIGQITTYGIYDLGNRKIDIKSANQYSGVVGCYDSKLFTPCKISDV